MDTLEHQSCPLCHKKTLTLTEEETDVPFFGRAYLFSMRCSSCGYFISDIEAEQERDPVKYTLEINNESDMKIRIVKSSNATVRFKELKMSMEPGSSSTGFITNVEGLLERFKQIIEQERDSNDDEDVRENAKRLLKKIWKIKLGDNNTTLIIEDPGGNSAIISEKAKVEKLKK